MRLSYLHLESLPILGLPLKYLTVDFAEYLADIIGSVQWIDWLNGIPRNFGFFRARVRIKSDDPLFMGFYLRLDNYIYLWLQFKYERIFTMCFPCGCIGHKANTCN